MFRSHRRGFTLIELLVVIAIIAILAALLFPTFIRAKKSGQTSACCSNMKQIATAFTQYCTDHDGKVPRICAWNPVTGEIDTGSLDGQSTWLYYNATYYDLKSYIKNSKIFTCPGAGLDCDFELIDGVKGRRYEVDYRFNDTMNKKVTSRVGSRYTTTVDTLRLDSCRFPKRFYILSDRHSNHHYDNEKVNGSMQTWVMVMVMADSHVTTKVKPYDNVWKDSKGRVKYEHWDFPNCHSTDPVVIAEY